jgi:hypothetical protein
MVAAGVAPIDPVMPATGLWEKKSCESVEAFLAAYGRAAKERASPLEVRPVRLSHEALAQRKVEREPGAFASKQGPSIRNSALDSTVRQLKLRLNEIMCDESLAKKAPTAETRSTSASSTASRRSLSPLSPDFSSEESEAEVIAQKWRSSRRASRGDLENTAGVGMSSFEKGDGGRGGATMKGDADLRVPSSSSSLADAAFCVSAAFVLGFGATRCFR